MAGILACLLSSLTWAIGSSAYARASHRHTAYSINLTRALGAAPLFLLAAAFLGDWSTADKLLGSTGLWFALSVFSSYGIGDLVFLASAKRLGVPGALSIGAVFPVWNTLLGIYLRNEQLRATQVLGLVVTLFFLVIVILSGPRGAVVGMGATRHERNRILNGVLLAFLTSVFWATNSFCIALAGARVDPWIGNSFRMVVAIAMSTLLGWGMTRRLPRPLPASEWRPVLPIYWLEAFGGSAFYLYGLSHTSMALGATLSSLAPMFAVPIAWGLGTEKVSWLRLSGVMGVLFGLWLLLTP